MKSPGKHLILDLDETMVHTFRPEDNFESIKLEKGTSFEANVFKIKFEDGTIMHGVMRPGLKLFMSAMFKAFDSVSVWSAGTAPYVHKVLSAVFGDNKKYFKFIMTRSDCNNLKIDYDDSICTYKPLSVVYAKYPEMNSKNTIIIDDRHDVCEYNCMNNIVIPAFDINNLTYQEYDSDRALFDLIKWSESKGFKTSANVQSLKNISPFPI